MLTSHEQDFLGSIEAYHDTDYSLGTLDKAPKSYAGVQYNQNEVASNSCSIHGAMGAYTDLTGYVFSLEERKKLWESALKLGASNDWGWTIVDAVDLIRRFKNDSTTFRVSLTGDEAKNAMNLGYSVVCGFRGNKAYKEDKADGSLDGLTFGSTTYGHVVRMIKDGDLLKIIDNYKGAKVNTYTIKPENLGKLVVNGVFFSNGYIFTQKTDNELAAKIKGLQVSKKMAISQGARKINDLEKQLSTLEGREPIKYSITTNL